MWRADCGPPLDQVGLKLAIRHGDRNELKDSRSAHVVLTDA